MIEKNRELINELKVQVEQLPHRDSNMLDALKRRSHLLINKIFGLDSDYHVSVNSISFRPISTIRTGGTHTNQGPYDRAWKTGKEKYINLVNTLLEDINLTIDFGINEAPFQSGENKNKFTDEVFIVHGHNEEMKQSIARTIEKLDLKPIILHEKANKGRTIIQKFIDHSDVGFAIILMSADDYGFSIKEPASAARLRARQNVIMELGFFLGKLGINRVVAIFEQNENFEIPSDYDGVIFIPYDNDGKWKFDIIKELKALEYQVDANKII